MKRINKFLPLVSAVLASLSALVSRPRQATPHQQQQAGPHTAAAMFTDTSYAISAALPATYDAAGYGLTSIVYTEITKVQDFPTYGSKRAMQKFTPIKGPVEKSKGAPDFGEGDMIMADVPADPGQVILKAAEPTQAHYSIKITYPDGELCYLDAIVTSWQIAQAKEGSYMLRTATLSICRAPVVVAAV